MLIGGLLSDALKNRGVFDSRIYVSITGIVSGMILMLALISYSYPYGDISLGALLPLMVFAFITFTATAWAGLNSSIAPLFGGFIIVAYKSIEVEGVSSYYYALVTATLAWIITVLLWLPLIKTYKVDYAKLVKTLEERTFKF